MDVSVLLDELLVDDIRVANCQQEQKRLSILEIIIVSVVSTLALWMLIGAGIYCKRKTNKTIGYQTMEETQQYGAVDAK